MFENHVVDHRIVQIMSNSFRSRVVLALGTMVNVDSEIFFTASDVGAFILERSGIDINSLQPQDLREYFGSISSILSDAYRKGSSEVRRTTKRIHPRHYMPGNAAYGYRIGYAIRKQPIDYDALREHRATSEVVPTREELRRDRPTALDIGEKAVALMDYNELCQLELTVQARKAKMFSELQSKFLRDKGERK